MAPRNFRQPFNPAQFHANAQPVSRQPTAVTETALATPQGRRFPSPAMPSKGGRAAARRSASAPPAGACALDGEADLQQLRTIVARGTSAQEQLALHYRLRSAGSSNTEALRAVVDWLAETSIAVSD